MIVIVHNKSYSLVFHYVCLLVRRFVSTGEDHQKITENVCHSVIICVCYELVTEHGTGSTSYK